MLDRLHRKHLAARQPSTSRPSSRQNSPQPSTSGYNSNQTVNPKWNARRPQSPSPVRSGSVKDRLGSLSSSVTSSNVASPPSTSTPSSSRAPPPPSSFRCVDVRYTDGEVGGYTERADADAEVEDSERVSRSREKGKRGKDGKGGKRREEKK